MTVRLGASEVVITPPLGVELAGYGPSLQRRSEAIGGHLTAQAIVLEQGRRQTALILCDLLALTPEFVGRVRARVEGVTGMAGSDVLVACSHSHTSPGTGSTREWGEPDGEYVDSLVRHLGGAAAWAQRRLQPVTLHVGRGQYRKLAWNRAGTDFVDPTVHTVHASDARGAAIAVLVQHACHPVILGPSSTISPDFPGAMRQRLKQRFPDAVVAFANGACGDIDPITNREAWGAGGPADVQRYGVGIARSALTAMAAARPLEGPTVEVVTGTLDLAYALPQQEGLEARIAELEAEVRERGGERDDAFGAVTGDVAMPAFWLRYHRDLLTRMRAGELAATESVELQLLALGPHAALLAIPAEVYARHGHAIKARSPFPDTIPVCYANGCYGYLPPAEVYAQGGYTARLAAAVYDRPPFRSDVADALLEASQRLLGRGYATILSAGKDAPQTTG